MITRVEVLESGGARFVAQRQEHDAPEEEGEESGDEKHPPVLVDAVSTAFEEPRECTRSRTHLVMIVVRACCGHDREAPVEGEVDAERDHEAEDGAEGSAMSHVEPGKLGRYDRGGAAGLEEHVHRVQDEERPELVEVPSEVCVAVEDQSHEATRDDRTHDPDEHAPTSTSSIDLRREREEAEQIERRSAHEDEVEVANRDGTAERDLCRVQDVPHEDEARIPHSQREPVKEPSPPELVCVDENSVGIGVDDAFI